MTWAWDVILDTSWEAFLPRMGVSQHLLSVLHNKTGSPAVITLSLTSPLANQTHWQMKNTHTGAVSHIGFLLPSYLIYRSHYILPNFEVASEDYPMKLQVVPFQVDYQRWESQQDDNWKINRSSDDYRWLYLGDNSNWFFNCCSS